MSWIARGRRKWTALSRSALGLFCLASSYVVPAEAQSSGQPRVWPIDLQIAVDHGYWAPVAVIGLLIVWHVLHGRLPINGGWSGKTIFRNGLFRRALHWVLAAAFFALAVTGLVSLYWERVAGAPPAGLNGSLHAWASVVFLVALGAMVIGSARHLRPTRYDAAWIRAGGVLLGNRRQPPAGRLTATQKILLLTLWIMGGLAASTGYGALDGPEFPRRALHAAIGIALISVIIAHAYFRSIGMQGAFDAVRTGDVDVNWAKQHHAVWAEDELWKAADLEEAADGGRAPSIAGPTTLRP